MEVNSCFSSCRKVYGILFFLMVISFPSISTGAATTAIPATNFLNSIGVCTHMGQGVDNPDSCAKAMKFAGIRSCRDDGRASRIQSWITVYQKAGVKTVLLTDHNITSTINMAKQLQAVGALLAVEGPNEPNNWPVTYEGQTSSSTTSLPIARFQRDLYAAVKAEPALKDIPVFHSSESGGSEPDNCGLQYLVIPSGAGTKMPDGTVYADYANVHNYVSGTQGKNIQDNQAWNAADPTLNGQWDGLWVEYGHTWWGGGFDGYTKEQLLTLPRVTTETGWTTAGASTSITKEQQGRLFLNLYLSQFKRGWSYTYIYMLRDDKSQGYWGLFDTNYVAKQSGTYLHNFTTILADSVAIQTPGQMDYSIPSQPTTTHELLLQKRNGVFDLVVWSELASGTSNVTVNLGTQYASVRVYDPIVGTSAAQSLSNVSSVALTISNYPMIIEVTPAPSNIMVLPENRKTSYTRGLDKNALVHVYALDGTLMQTTTGAVSQKMLPAGVYVFKVMKQSHVMESRRIVVSAR